MEVSNSSPPLIFELERAFGGKFMFLIWGSFVHIPWYVVKSKRSIKFDCIRWGQLQNIFSQKMFHLPKVCPLVAGWTWPAPALTWHIAKWTLHWRGTLCQYISFLLMLQVFLKMVIISLITGHFVYFSRWWQSCKLRCYASFVQYGWQWSRKVSTDQMWQEQDKTEAG